MHSVLECVVLKCMCPSNNIWLLLNVMTTTESTLTYCEKRESLCSHFTNTNSSRKKKDLGSLIGKEITEVFHSTLMDERTLEVAELSKVQ